MAELRLHAGSSSVVVDADAGGRLSSLKVGELQLLVVEPALGTLQWGSYPMVPWAGRIRGGKFEFGGIAYELPCNIPPHSAHGVGFVSQWTVVDEQTIELAMAPPWPFGGRVTQRFDLQPEQLTMTMIVEAEVDMPVMVGWHPWFNRYLQGPDGPVEAAVQFGPAMMYEIDDQAIPTGRLVQPDPPPWDNCFTALEQEPEITWPGLLDLRLSSNCDHWVVYSEPSHALCVEPESAAPDVFNRDPMVVKAGERYEAWFRLRWGGGGRPCGG